MAVVLAKKSKDMELVAVTSKNTALSTEMAKGLPQGYQRTSQLMSPVVQLTGHESEIFCAKFSYSGEILASSGFDRQIFVWTVYGESTNIAVLTGHTSAVLDLHFSPDDTRMYTASVDKTIGLWDVETATRIKRMKGHSNLVSSCSPVRRGPPLVCSGSDDSTVRIWDERRRGCITELSADYQVTSVCFSDTAEKIFSAGIDNVVKIWDLRKNAVSERLIGHADTITGLELSPDGNHLLTNAMDNTLRMWDVRPFAPQERCVKIFYGAQHTFEKNLLRCAWSPDGQRVTCGSGDRYVNVWDVQSQRLLYKLPGHLGSVNEVDFHPTEPIILSASSDRTLYLVELQHSMGF